MESPGNLTAKEEVKLLNFSVKAAKIRGRQLCLPGFKVHQTGFDLVEKEAEYPLKQNRKQITRRESEKVNILQYFLVIALMLPFTGCAGEPRRNRRH